MQITRRSISKRNTIWLQQIRCNHTQDSNETREIVRKLDNDNYFCGLLYPQHLRSSYFAIRALNVEIATIKDATRGNIGSGKLRLQWWRDRINELYEDKNTPMQDTPLLRELGRAIHQHKYTRRWFDNLLDAREDDLEVDELETMRDLEKYAEKTAGSLMYLSLETLGLNDPKLDEAATHAGIAIGVTMLLRGSPYHRMKEQTYLPIATLKHHGFTLDDVYLLKSAKDGQKLAPVVFDVACCALHHLRRAKKIQSQAQTNRKISQPAFLGLVSTENFLRDLEKLNFNVYDPSLSTQSTKGRLGYIWQVVKRHVVGN